MLTLIPAAERPFFSQFKDDIQQEVARILPHLHKVAASESVAAALVEQAAEAGMAEGTFRRKYYAWRAHGCKGLVPGNKVPKYLVSASARITTEFVAEWRRRIENMQRRGMRQAWNQMLREIRAGETVKGLPHWTKMWQQDYPGRLIPPSCPLTWIPKSLTYNNLKGLAPTEHELRLARQGRRAAAELRPLVLSTRAGLKVNQILVFDDMWHDHKVNFFDLRQTQALRPLEFHCIDLFSTRKIAYGVRPRLLREDGTHDQLKDREMRQLLCQVLCCCGYRPDGTCLHVEQGTAKIGKDLEEYLDYATDGAVTVQRGAIDKRPLLKGAFRPRGMGNFRFKASLESLGNLYHNALSALPGQTGLSPAMQPESLAGLDDYNASLLSAILKMSPERAAKLWFPVLEWNEFSSLLMEIYERIDSRTDHNLEGWGEAGNIEQVFIPGPGMDPVPMSLIMANADQFKGAIQLAHADPEHFVANRRLSPAAVHHRGAHELVRVNIIHAPMILGRDNAVGVVVNRKNECWVVDPDIHRRTRYSPEMRQFHTPFSNILPAGNSYFFYPIPGDTRAVVCDEHHRPLGWTVQMSVASKADDQSILQAHGQSEHIRALMESGYRERHAPEAEQLKQLMARNDAIKQGDDPDATAEDPAPANDPEMSSAQDAYLQSPDAQDGPPIF